LPATAVIESPPKDPVAQSDAPSSDLADAPDVELEDAIEQLHGVHCAAHAHLLRILGEFEAREGWKRDAASSAAAWVRCRAQVSLETAREWVRVAIALRTLPRIAAAYADGRLSWDKLAELTRFATPESDGRLAEDAEGWTAEMTAQVARRARRMNASDARTAHDRRALTLRWDPTHEMLHLRARLAAADGEIVAKALDRLADRQPKAPDGTYVEGHIRLADALVELASTRLVQDQDADRAVVVIHADAAGVAAGTGNGEFESGAVVAAETLDRLMCDAHIETVVHADGGKTIGIGPRSRNIPGWLMRQLRARDQGCRFPGCGRRRLLHGHHIEHWPGPTNLDNLACLCRFHHHLVHEGEWSMRGHPDARLEFIRPDGSVYEPGPRALREDVRARMPVPALLL
jgi:uncharacterized protein DUF222